MSTSAVSGEEYIRTEAPYKDLGTGAQLLFSAKAKKGCSFEDIGKAIGRDEVWVASVFYGQAIPTENDVKGIAEFLDLSADGLSSELKRSGFIHRGDLGPMPPKDPVIYRLYEGIMVYGYPIKVRVAEVMSFATTGLTEIPIGRVTQSVIHEKFGDGIMSLIDCKVHVDRKPDPKGDRVLLTFEYVKWSSSRKVTG
ncbi:Cyanate hydratase [Tulasnella sp. 427]|nr:Cyanate hydratase [Tulasnella sp. 427]